MEYKLIYLRCDLPRHDCALRNPLTGSQGGKEHSFQSSCDQKDNSESVLLRANPEYKPPLRLTRKTRGSLKPDILRKKWNCVAAKKCRLKKNKEQQETQSVLGYLIAKRESLLAQVSVLKEVWQLKHQVFENATACNAQWVNRELVPMNQNAPRADILQLHDRCFCLIRGLMNQL